MRISSQLMLIFLFIGLVILAMLGATAWSTAQQHTDALIINLAGRERMLCQKLCKDIITLQAIKDAGEETGDIQASLTATQTVFETTFTALLHGGQAPLTLDPKGPVTVLPPAPPAVARHMTDVDRQWKMFISHASTAALPPASLRELARMSDEVVTSMSRAVSMFQELADAKVKRVTAFQYAGTALIIIILIVNALKVRMHLTRPLRLVSAYAQELAKGNLDAQLEGRFIQELSVLSTSLQTMVASMTRMLKEAESNETHAAQSAMEALQASMEATRALEQAETAKQQGMREAAEALREMGTALIRATTTMTELINSVAGGAHQQEQLSGQTADSMEAINISIRNVAHNAEDAEHQASSTRDEAARGADLVSEVVLSIGNLEASSTKMAETISRLNTQVQEIGSIIITINDIADQTNLLALNAAIEAARAGETGRGFAVVADEVRKLAEKTMIATKEVTGTVQGIQKLTRETQLEMVHSVVAVNNSTDSAHIAGNSLESIVHTVEETARRIRQIAAASAEQRSASQEITENMGRIADVAANTATGMREAQGIIRELTDITDSLERVIHEMAGNQQSASKSRRTPNSPTPLHPSTLIEWSSHLAVGIEVIDDQHRKLVSMINNLHQSIAAQHNQNDLAPLLIELKEYAVSHFATEEELFRKHDYPATEEHIGYHRKLAARVLDFEEKFTSGKAAIGTELLLFLKDWLVDHIIRVDKRYMDFLHSKGVR